MVLLIVKLAGQLAKLLIKQSLRKFRRPPNRNPDKDIAKEQFTGPAVQRLSETAKRNLKYRIVIIWIGQSKNYRITIKIGLQNIVNLVSRNRKFTFILLIHNNRED